MTVPSQASLKHQKPVLFVGVKDSYPSSSSLTFLVWHKKLGALRPKSTPLRWLDPLSPPKQSSLSTLNTQQS